MKVASTVVLAFLTFGSIPAIALDAYDEMLELQGVSFQVQCENAGSLNTLTLTPSGLEIDNSPVTLEVDGAVTGAEIADLNADGSPEIYVYVSSAGSGAYGSVAAWSANKRKSLSEIYLPELAEDPEYSEGYMGHDEFAVVEQYLVRRFPVYREGDSNAAPGGGTRQVQYILEAGEAGWKLVAVKAENFE